MTDRHIYLFTPTYTGRPDIENLYCMLDTVQTIANQQWDIKCKFTVGDSLIPRARNMACADVYQNPQYTDLVMLDDDVKWEPGAVVRLLQHPCDVVLGAYPKRADPLQFPIKRIAGEQPDPKTGLMKVRMGPAGFLRITRNAIVKMVTHYHNQRIYYDPLVPGKKAWALFMLELAPSEPDEPNEFGINELWGEDFTFCKLWRAIGGDVYLDTLLTFQHIGRKAYEGCYAEHLPGFVESLQPQSAA